MNGMNMMNGTNGARERRAPRLAREGHAPRSAYEKHAPRSVSGKYAPHSVRGGNTQHLARGGDTLRWACGKHALCAAVLVAVLALVGVSLAGCSQSGLSEEEEEILNNAISVTCENSLDGAESEEVTAWATESVYNEEAQATIAEELQAEHNGQTLEDPLVEYNPFGTNTQSLYVYFETEDAASVSYTVSVFDSELDAISDELSVDSIDDFTREVASGASSTEHEFQVIGLIPSVQNVVTLTATYEDGTEETTTLAVDMCDVLGEEELQLDVTQGTSDAELSDGLYVVLGNDSDDADFMYYYDNQGILRGEVPVIGYRSHRMLFDEENTMYYSISHNSMAALSTLGQITNVYDLGNYNLHHDYVWAGDAQSEEAASAAADILNKINTNAADTSSASEMLVLATDTSRNDSDEDLVISLNVETGEVTELLDMGDLLSTFKEEAFAYHEANYEPEEGEEDDVAGWMHINSIQYIASEDAVLLSSRETSTIFKISNISTSPEIEYMLASDLFWADTEYEDLVFEQVGDFLVHGGQHCLVYVEDESLDEGQYYLRFFNNNLGVSASTTNDFDYAGAGISTPANSDETSYSYYYEYLVDENEGTFELVDSMEVAYSGYVSSIQWLDGNLIIDSGSSGLYTEYDENGEAICTFSMGADKFIYRVFKYDL